MPRLRVARSIFTEGDRESMKGCRGLDVGCRLTEVAVPEVGRSKSVRIASLRSRPLVCRELLASEPFALLPKPFRSSTPKTLSPTPKPSATSCANLSHRSCRAAAMPATIAFAEACGINSSAASSAPMRRLACSASFSPVQFQLLTCQVLEPVSVQQEKINRPWAAENSNSSLFTLQGARPSMDMNQSVCVRERSEERRVGKEG